MTDDLAARLRELKDRSGQSFGTLAQKLHVGTSTLHRYCSGDAVPAEFGILDKFGRLCGATPDELVALHRAWLLADAQRARGAEAAPVEPAPETPAVTPLPAEHLSKPTNTRRAVVITAVLLVLCAVAGGLTAWFSDSSSDEALQKTGPPSGDQLTTTVRADVWDNGCDHSYLVDRPPADVPEPPVEADAFAWSDRLGAVDQGRTIVEVTVRGIGAEPVVLQGLTVRMGERRAPLAWNVYAMSLGCGGALTPASYAVDLDQPRPVARPRPGNDGENQLPAMTFPFRVSSTEPVVLRVVAKTASCDCDWHLELAWTSSTGSGKTVINDSGNKDFRTSGSTSKPYGYLERWER